jgi:hypothetical protein
MLFELTMDDDGAMLRFCQEIARGSGSTVVVLAGTSVQLRWLMDRINHGLANLGEQTHYSPSRCAIALEHGKDCTRIIGQSLSSRADGIRPDLLGYTPDVIGSPGFAYLSAHTPERPGIRMFIEDQPLC